MIEYIIDRGKIIALDTPSKLKEIVGGGDIIKLRLGDNKEDIDMLLKDLSFIREIETDADGSVILSVEDASRNLPIILKRINVESVEFSNHNLNDVFIHFTAQNFKEHQKAVLWKNLLVMINSDRSKTNAVTAVTVMWKSF